MGLDCSRLDVLQALLDLIEPYASEPLSSMKFKWFQVFLSLFELFQGLRPDEDAFSTASFAAFLLGRTFEILALLFSNNPNIQARSSHVI